MKSREITVGTRSSLLALTQAHKFLVELQAISKTDYSELLHSKTQLILTEGDLKQGTQDAGKLTKKAWIREIEDALVDGRIDVAIHSGKDIPADIHEDTKLLPILRREYPFDIFIGKIDENGNRKKFSSLDADALIGTASLRRRLFSQRINPNFKIVEHRGNVPTRLTKLDESESLSGIILAEASLKRLGFNIEYETLENYLIPSASQGILVAQYRSNDVDTESLVKRVVFEDVLKAFTMERHISSSLQADCNSCIGIYCSNEGQNLNLTVHAINPKTLDEIKIDRSYSEGSSIRAFSDEVLSELYSLEIEKFIH